MGRNYRIRRVKALSRKEQSRSTTGFFGIGVYHPKTESNIGTLMRTAFLYKASFVYTIGARYRRQASDTPNTAANVPLFHFETVDDLVDHLPHAAPLVAVELDDRAVTLRQYQHHRNAVYMLGAEDAGIPEQVLAKCHEVVTIESPMPWSMNVATAGSLVIYDRFVKKVNNHG